MKHKSVLSFLYIVGMVLSATTLCSAQENDGFLLGYIVTLENDTLRGFLRVEDKDHLPDTKRSIKKIPPKEMWGQRKFTTLAFREKSSSRVKAVNLSEIKGYSVDNNFFPTKKRLYFEKKYWDEEIAGTVTLYASDDKIRTSPVLRAQYTPVRGVRYREGFALQNA